MRRQKSSTIRKTLSAVTPQAYTERSIQSTDISVQKAASGAIAQQRADAAGPGGRLGAGPLAVAQPAEPMLGDENDVPAHVAKAPTRPDAGPQSRTATCRAQVGQNV